jgi:hypothetical protein
VLLDCCISKLYGDEEDIILVDMMHAHAHSSINVVLIPSGRVTVEAALTAQKFCLCTLQCYFGTASLRLRSVCSSISSITARGQVCV